MTTRLDEAKRFALQASNRVLLIFEGDLDTVNDYAVEHISV